MPVRGQNRLMFVQAEAEQVGQKASCCLTCFGWLPQNPQCGVRAPPRAEMYGGFALLWVVRELRGLGSRQLPGRTAH